MKKLSLLGVAIFLSVLMLAPVFAQGKGPAQKATGDFWARSYHPNSDSLVYLDFNAHEPMNGRAAKGEIYWYRDHPSYGPRELWMDVKYVEVEEEWSYIAALCWMDTAGTQFGKWLYLIVEDGGTPGRNGDTIYARWYNAESDAENAVEQKSMSHWVAYDLVEGNLVVHN